MLNFSINRSLLINLAFCCGLAALAGCGAETAPFVPEASYTPEALASELAFRYGKMDPVSRPRPVIAPRNREPAGTAEKVETKSKEKAKAERAVTLEDLVDEVVLKSRQVPGTKPEEVLLKIAGLVEKDEKIKPADRRLIAERLVQSK